MVLEYKNQPYPFRDHRGGGNIHFGIVGGNANGIVKVTGINNKIGNVVFTNTIILIIGP